MCLFFRPLPTPAEAECTTVDNLLREVTNTPTTMTATLVRGILGVIVLAVGGIVAGVGDESLQQHGTEDLWIAVGSQPDDLALVAVGFEAEDDDGDAVFALIQEGEALGLDLALGVAVDVRLGQRFRLVGAVVVTSGVRRRGY